MFIVNLTFFCTTATTQFNNALQQNIILQKHKIYARDNASKMHSRNHEGGGDDTRAEIT